MGDWAELDRFAKSKKSPIGYEVRNEGFEFAVVYVGNAKVVSILIRESFDLYG
jgi:hypothetical protein